MNLPLLPNTEINVSILTIKVTEQIKVWKNTVLV